MRKKLILVFIVMWTLYNNAKAQLDRSAHEIKDSLNLVLLPQIKIPTKTLLDSALQKEAQISVADYFYYFASYRYLQAARRAHPAIIFEMAWDYVPINDRNEKIYVKIQINGNHLLYNYSDHELLSRIKEVNRIYVTKGDPKQRLGDNYIKINYVVNQSYIGTKDEIGFGNNGPQLKPRNFLK